MNNLQLVWRNIRQQFGSTLLSILLTAFGVAILCVIYITSDSLEKQLTNNSKNIDLVVGAKGSPLQLILSSLYHIDNPTGNIALSEARKLATNPFIELAVPISLGDNFKGHRLIGTEISYFQLYDLRLAQGMVWKKAFEAVIGADVARKRGLKVGDSFHTAHGLSADGHVHDEHPFRVVGVLNKSNSVVDNLILCNLESVWDVHGIAHEDHNHDDHDHDHDGHDHDHAHTETNVKQEVAAAVTTPVAQDSNQAVANKPVNAHNHDSEGHDDHDHAHDSTATTTAEESSPGAARQAMMEARNAQQQENLIAPAQEAQAADETLVKNIGDDMIEDRGEEVTALLIKYSSPAAIGVIPRLVNQSTDMQAASPAIESTRLFSLLGVGLDSLTALAFIIMLIAGLSVFISLYNALKDRKYDLAIMRSLGASKGKLFSLVILEGFIITLIGGIIGLLLGHIALYLINQQTSESADFIEALVINEKEFLLVAVACAIGIFAALIPAIKAYKTSISTILADK
ncbi:ABC transporter permease [Sphingobacterium psychroaquaticum]|uniref:ABC transporter permease n=1 Tax=Sphingobacterium psychroaquaticum TaxID=561061 RepID=UPI001F0E746F|nr:ABC transporter permease [Sphingobacterium psychroaquaticum]